VAIRYSIHNRSQYTACFQIGCLLFFYIVWFFSLVSFCLFACCLVFVCLFVSVSVVLHVFLTVSISLDWTCCASQEVEIDFGFGFGFGFAPWTGRSEEVPRQCQTHRDTQGSFIRSFVCLFVRFFQFDLICS
jgi:hypothetical protein